MSAAIQLAGLVKSFRGTHGPVHAVRGVDLSISAGETVALLGPNGAGKSTTIDMMLGLAAPDEGAVSLFGRSPHGAVAGGVVGAMMQTGELIRDLSVRELVAMIASLYPAPMDIDGVIGLAGLGEVAEQRTQKLSGGESQRVRFAVAIVGDPDLLVLDEPTVAMDVGARHEFWSSMHDFAARGKTVIFATHYMEEADANADRAVLMAHGRIVADGPTTEIKAQVGTKTIRATLPEGEVPALAHCPASQAPSATASRSRSTAPTPTARSVPCSQRYPSARDIEITGAGSRRRSWP